jgi:demethylmenaquinone methyltransferase/2-methoxy-6-polyprenyl-1,4-benzoquinol methylase
VTLGAARRQAAALSQCRSAAHSGHLAPLLWHDRDVDDYYARRAPEYDRIYERPERQADLRAIRAWLGPQFQGRRVLDVACGTGYWTPVIAAHAESLWGVDTAEATLQIARGRPLPAGSRARFDVGDAYALPRAQPACNAAFAGFWISHVPSLRLREFLQGLHAVLEPGSVVVFLDNLYVPGSSTHVSEPDENGDTWQWRTLTDGSRHRVLKNFPGQAQLREALDTLATQADYLHWDHYWALRWTTADTPP